MSESLSLQNPPNCTLTRVGAEFDSAIDFAKWIEAGKRLLGVSACVNWWIGDWLNFGEKRYGDKYKLAAEQLDIDTAVLWNYAYIASAVETSTRVEDLSWSHHREVAPLNSTQQTFWLAKAQSEKWTVSELRQALRAENAEVKHDDKSRLADDYNPVEFAIKTIKWFNSQPPLTTWSRERREATKQCLQPVVELWEKL
jgi:hypothetical protein